MENRMCSETFYVVICVCLVVARVLYAFERVGIPSYIIHSVYKV